MRNHQNQSYPVGRMSGYVNPSTQSRIHPWPFWEVYFQRILSIGASKIGFSVRLNAIIISPASVLIAGHSAALFCEVAVS